MPVLGESKKTFKLTYVAPSTWRKIFLIYDNEVFRPKEKTIYDRQSTIPMFFVGSKVKIYSGAKFHSRIVNRWMVGYKFGEFSWTRKLALYKAKQLKKKKNNEIWTRTPDILNKGFSNKWKTAEFPNEF
jgi:ribosomal protein S19